MGLFFFIISQIFGIVIIYEARKYGMSTTDFLILVTCAVVSVLFFEMAFDFVRNQEDETEISAYHKE